MDYFSDMYMYGADEVDFRVKPPAIPDLEFLAIQFTAEFGIKPEYQYAFTQVMLENRGEA